MNENQATRPGDAHVLDDSVAPTPWPAWQVALLWLALVVGIAIEIAAELRCV